MKSRKRKGERENMELLIRAYEPDDCAQLAALFYNTVHIVNARDYSQEQLDAWADGKPDLAAWDRSFREHLSLVALSQGEIVGFGDMAPNGYLDRLYVRADRQRQGIASALCDHLEQAVSGSIETHASLTARLFFEQRGYRVVREQQVERRGQLLTNFVMVKER